jgi:hypothetical protein
MPSIGKLAGQGYDPACWAEPRTRRMSALTPNTPASAARASAPCRTGTVDLWVWLFARGSVRGFLADQGFSPPPPISYCGVKLPRVSAPLGRFYLRRGADLPQVGRLPLTIGR